MGRCLGKIQVYEAHSDCSEVVCQDIVNDVVLGGVIVGSWSCKDAFFAVSWVRDCVVKVLLPVRRFSVKCGFNFTLLSNDCGIMEVLLFIRVLV